MAALGHVAAIGQPIETMVFRQDALSVDLLSEMREAGTHHVALNITDSARPPADVIEEVAGTVLPHFHGAAVA